ncbi:Ig-like domain-containing protein [Actinomadura sp. SCN-SB]|uniref:Ig-like domain-containing protein n=1 Tax=Actinomadura sp. SCN-SB TaxID=3373092 RepID=UPI0037500CDC
MAMRVKGLAAAGFACAMLALGGCSGAGDSGDGDAAGGGGPTLTITSPAEGATVTAPVTLTFTSSEDIGPEESGKHHVHVTIDGKTDDYEVVTSTTHRIDGLTPGRHRIGVTLQHADHSDAGASAQVNVNVAGGGQTTAPSGGGETTAPSGGGGGYDYP